MGLKKASNSGHHPALPASELAADSARVVREAEQVAKQAAVSPPPLARTVDVPSPARTPARPASAGQRDEAAQAVQAGEGRRGKTSHRGKKSVLFAWPSADVRLIVQATKKQRRAYKQAMRENDPHGTFNLTVSNVTATALTRALAHPEDWANAEHVRNDARRAPASDRVALEDVGLTWPLALIERLTDAWEDLDAEGEWPDRFNLTKANLAVAGILHEIRTLDSWLIEVPNDDRFTPPTDTDGRRRTADA